MTLDYIDTVEPLSSDPFLNFHQSELCGCINMLSYFIAYTSLNYYTSKKFGNMGFNMYPFVFVSVFFFNFIINIF